MKRKRREPITFDRFGKCPICGHLFKSKDCPHSYGHVARVVDDVNSSFDDDVRRARRGRR